MANLADELTLLTCRIVATDALGKSSLGTGFFFSFSNGPKNALVLVTNRHVVKNQVSASIVISQADEAGVPIAGQHLKADYPDLQRQVFYHPDPSVDLACLGVAEALTRFHSAGSVPHFKALTPSEIPPDDVDLTAIEEILMVGYPTGLYDRKNNRPIVRRGITASSYKLDYDGRPEFLIDAACFPGSSGSPVVIANTGTYMKGGQIVLGGRFLFLGVLWGGPQFTATGEVEPVPIPTVATHLAQTRIPLNLGFCVKAREVKVMVDALLTAIP